MSILLRRYYQLLNNQGWLHGSTKLSIMQAFGNIVGSAIIELSNDYLNGIAATNLIKAQSIAAFIKEDPMIVCSLGISVEGVTMPIRYCNTNGTFLNPDVYYTGGAADVTLKVRVTSSGFIGVNGIMQYNCPTHSKIVELKWVRRGSTCLIYTDGVQTGSSVYSGFSGYFGLLRLGDGSGWHSSNPQGKIAYADFYKDGVFIKNLYPFVRNNVVGMLNMNTNQLELPVSGTWTIGYELPDGTPWDPGTPLP